MKGPDGRGLQTKEETMSTFTTIAEMQRLADRELHILFATVTELLARTAKAHKSAARS
jgi:hypothetical protein